MLRIESETFRLPRQKTTKKIPMKLETKNILHKLQRCLPLALVFYLLFDVHKLGHFLFKRRRWMWFNTCRLINLMNIQRMKWEWELQMWWWRNHSKATGKIPQKIADYLIWRTSSCFDLPTKLVSSWQFAYFVINFWS